MLNHREVLEALLAGKAVRDIVDEDMLVYLGTDGRLYDQKNTVIGSLYLGDWKLSPETIEINGIKVPKGETVVPDRGDTLVTPVIHDHIYYYKIDWNDSQLHHDLLSKGLLHLTKEDAIAHAKALLSFTNNSDE